MTNGRKPLSDNVTGRPRIPVPRIDAIATKSTQRILSILGIIHQNTYKIENNAKQSCITCDKVAYLLLLFTGENSRRKLCEMEK